MMDERTRGEEKDGRDGTAGVRVLRFDVGEIVKSRVKIDCGSLVLR